MNRDEIDQIRDHVEIEAGVLYQELDDLRKSGFYDSEDIHSLGNAQQSLIGVQVFLKKITRLKME